MKAFPNIEIQGYGCKVYHQGMDLEDYFAGEALKGMLSYSAVNPMKGNFVENCSAENVAQRAYEYADEMVKIRQKRKKENKKWN